MLQLPISFVCRQRKDLAVDTFIPLLNQLVSLTCCQEGVRSGGLGAAADFGSGDAKARDPASLPERMKEPLQALVKIQSYTMTKHLQAFQAQASFLCWLLHSFLLHVSKLKQ